MNFSKQYFDDIWGSVHRHDYCDSLATQLIQKYGKVSFLDLGTGCGFLVKTLRERGCDAYGLEVSDYAIENSCAKGYVMKGDGLNLPFADKRFDVVMSQGMWEYVKEEDIPHLRDEVFRVGKRHEYNIDTTVDTGPWTKDFATHKPIEWWHEILKPPRVLVACPNHIIKEYAFRKWIDNVKNLTYANYDIFVVDNSPSHELFEKYKEVPIVKLPVEGIEDLAVTRMNRSYELIRKQVLDNDYQYLMVIESDVIPQKDVIEILMSYKGDWISHAYPARNGKDELAQQGIGCSLLSRRLLEKFGWADAEDHTTADGWLWDRVRPFAYDFPTIELWGILSIQHLGESNA